MKRFLTILVISILAMGGYAYACKVTVVDACPNIDSVQQAVPDGYHLNDDKECVPDEIVVPPAPEPTPPAPEVTPPVEVTPTQVVIPASPPADFQGK